MSRIVVDPITRIEGHLRIEATVENGAIVDAWSSGTMVRGFEKILKGRDPRDAWAFTERACGVCTTVHALASVRSVEDALGIVVPQNAELIRNLMAAVQYVQDHVIHFYHLHALDWVDVVSALDADPKATSELAQSISSWPKSSPGYFSDLKRRLTGFVESGQLGIFANGYWGHPGYKLPPEANLMAVAHYLEALRWQKELIKIHTIFGGKNPHPNYLVGGVPCSLNIDEVNAINNERLNQVRQLIDEGIDIVEQLYLPDLLAIAPFYGEWFGVGGGLRNYLAYGDFPTRGYNHPDFFKYPRGAVLDRDLGTVHEVNGRDAEEIKEYIAHSWYRYEGGDAQGLHPWDGETELTYTGPQPPYEHLDVDAKYSWIKTPRWREHPMEVGPLARLVVGYASGREDIREVVDSALAALGAPVDALFSTLGRTAARGLETRLTARWMREFFDALVDNVRSGITDTHNGDRWDPATWPDEADGVGLVEAPRGALAHWIRIRDRKIDNYQLVVPSTWNASPRDPRGQRSSYEESLIGTPVANVEQPLEILRTVHSFDPCIACAVHLYDPDGKHVADVRVDQIGGDAVAAPAAPPAASPASTAAPSFKRVYVWEFPVRAYHWINAACVVALIASGYLIGNPTTIRYSEEAYQQYWFGTVRMVHFTAAFVFFFNFLVRIYWGFVGNRFARLARLVPYRRTRLREIGRVLDTDVLLRNRGEPHFNLGHNALAATAYLASFAMSLFMACTGFALYSSMSASLLPRGFAWVVPLMGGDLAVRQWHHAGMWFFVLFTMVHVYLVFYHDYVEGRGTTSSMVGGWKFERDDILERRDKDG